MSTSPFADASISSGMSRSRAALQSTTRLIRHRPWTWPLLFALVVGTLAFFLNRAIQQTIERKLAEELQTILDADVTALRLWLKGQEQTVAFIAGTDEIRTAAITLAQAIAQSDIPRRDLLGHEALTKVRRFLRSVCESNGYIDFAIARPDGLIIAAAQDDALGLTMDASAQPHVDRVLAGETIIVPPETELMPLRGWDGKLYLGEPVMAAVSLITDSQGEVIALLSVSMRPTGLSEILQVARMGESGETYAFNRQGRLLSRSRFEGQLKRIGLLPDNADATSTLAIEIRDPGVNMTSGTRPNVSRSEQPLTRMARSAIKTGDGVDTTGYNDYRGVPVVGAWTWLDEYDMGVTTEVDVAEAYQAFTLIRWFGYANLGLLLAASMAMFVASAVISRQESKLREARLEAKQLGQYTLDEKLGHGGMGVVYRGHHAMLRRPTAIKMLHPERVSEESIARFEREVQITSELTHPNTVVIYDYGRTPEGVFYYAMEYLDGINLSQLVDFHGPQPEGRVINILEQVCGSLAEAHYRSLIHRDVKPANVVLTCRGGRCDFPKIVDFGLVKVVDAAQQANLTMAGSMTGTPHYMSPEAIQDPDLVDARSDLYALGAVGYWLLTGRTVFESDHVFEVCSKHVEDVPPKPSDLLDQPINDDLEALLLQCLAKDKHDRPASAAALRTALLNCASAGRWSEAEACAWWQKHEPSRSAATLPS